MTNATDMPRNTNRICRELCPGGFTCCDPTLVHEEHRCDLRDCCDIHERKYEQFMEVAERERMSQEVD